MRGYKVRLGRFGYLCCQKAVMRTCLQPAGLEERARQKRTKAEKDVAAALVIQIP